MIYLIAHVVRSKPAFDIAERMECPICEGDGNLSDGVIGISGDDGMVVCKECSGEGHWWIIPTSGHRARPYWHIPIECLALPPNFPLSRALDDALKIENHTPPEGWPDHYPASHLVETDAERHTDEVGGHSLLSLLGLSKPKPKIKRRI